MRIAYLLSMSIPRVDIISIGTLSRNRLWNESAPVRTAHSTTTLVRSGRRNVLIDPGLPAAALGARLFERTGLSPDKIDTVFLTNFRPAHRGGLSLFANAKLLAHELEIDAARRQIEQSLAESQRAGGAEESEKSRWRAELELLRLLVPAEDKIADGVGIFPLFGYTPGTCGLIVTTPATTTIVAGDAVASRDHFLAGQVLPDAQDVGAAQEAFQEVYEIADLIVPGHDNIFANPRGQGM